MALQIPKFLPNSNKPSQFKVREIWYLLTQWYLLNHSQRRKDLSWALKNVRFREGRDKMKSA